MGWRGGWDGRGLCGDAAGRWLDGSGGSPGGDDRRDGGRRRGRRTFGLLKDRGISVEEAEFYAEGVRDGGSLVTVHEVSETRGKAARDTLQHCGAIRVESLADDVAGESAAPVVFNTCGEERG